MKTKIPKRMTIKEVWPDLDYMPDTEYTSKNSWESVKELQQGLKNRGIERELLPNGIRYREWSEGVKSWRVFEVTLA